MEKRNKIIVFRLKENKFIDKNKWYFNHASPIVKFLHNLTFLGFYISRDFGIFWVVLFNPLMVIFYICLLFMLLINNLI